MLPVPESSEDFAVQCVLPLWPSCGFPASRMILTPNSLVFFCLSFKNLISIVARSRGKRSARFFTLKGKSKLFTCVSSLSFLTSPWGEGHYSILTDEETEAFVCVRITWRAVNTQITGLHLSEFLGNSVPLGWDCSIWISNKFPSGWWVFQQWVISPPSRHLAMSGDTFFPQLYRDIIDI